MIAILLLGAVADARYLDVGFASDDFVSHRHAQVDGLLDAWRRPLWDFDVFMVWRPFLDAVFRLEVFLFGIDARGFQVCSAAWHIATALLVFALARSLAAPHPAAAAGAAFFLLWPRLAACNGWITGNASMPPATFSLLAAVAHQSLRREGRRSWSALALSAGVLAVLSKENGFLVLLVPLAADLFGPAPRPGFRRLLLGQIPFALAALALLAARRLALGKLSGSYFATDTLGTILARGAGALSSLPEILAGVPAEAVPEAPAVRWVAAGLVALALAGSWIPSRPDPAWAPGPEPAHGGWSARGAAFAWSLLLLHLGFNLLLLPDQDLSAGYRWYAVGAHLAVVFALGAGAAPRVRVLRVALLVLPLFLAAHLRLQDRIVLDSRRHERVLGGLRAAVATLPPETTAAFVHGLRGRWPFFAWGLREALAPPFTERALPCPVYPIDDAGRPRGIRSAPVEMLVYLRDAKPVVLQVGDDDRVTIIEAASQGSRNQVAQVVEGWFPAGRLELSKPGQDVVPSQPRQDDHPIWPVRQDLVRIDYHVFTTEVARVHGGVRLGDSWHHPVPTLETRALTRDGARIYVLPIGYAAPAPEAPLLGPLLVFGPPP